MSNSTVKINNSRFAECNFCGKKESCPYEFGCYEVDNRRVPLCNACFQIVWDLSCKIVKTVLIEKENINV